MENYSYSSYPDSGDSSPRSREIDSENQSWDEPLATNYKVKFMCSYGGKIQPRQHDNQLAYVGGDTKILAVDRNVKFPAFMSKLSALYGDDNVCFKYQLPGEDLDALISVTNDEDLEHMMLEYDRLYRASTKPARLRLFIFPLNPKVTPIFGAPEPKSERQWFVDALNSVQIQTLEGASPPAAAAAAASAANPDFLFGLDNKPKLAEVVTSPTAVTEVVGKDVTAGSDCGSEDRHLITDHLVEIQRQEFQRLNVTGVNSLEQVNQAPRVSYVGQKIVTEKVAPPPGQLPMPMQMTIPATYLTERHLTAANYQTEQPVYIIPSAQATGMYSTPTMRPMAPAPGGQAYYGMQRVMTEQPVYNVVSQAPKVGGYNEGIGVMQQSKGGIVADSTGYLQVGYDNTGRQVYYTTAAAQMQTQGGMMAQYQAVAVDGRQGGGPLNQEGGKVMVNNMAPQSSSN